MSRFKRSVLWAALIAIILLTSFSIYGAFLGAERAQQFFNSVPLVVYWLALAALLVVGIVVFRRLLRVPSLLLMHLGCIAILAGGMRGSAAGHALQKRLFGIDKIREGRMPILERTQENHVQLQDSNDVRELPFFVRLNNFRMEYYRPGDLMIRSGTGQSWTVPAEAGRSLSLGEDLGNVTVQRVFENFKIDIQGDERVAYDAPGGSNPALEVSVEKPNGPARTRYVFERMPGHGNPNDPLTMGYRRTVSDYISELAVVKDGKVVAEKDIEVNHPLHYGGYHFYQHRCGENEFGEYTILMVVSDSGLNLVYAGYVMLVAGVSWHFWGRRTLAAVRNRKPNSSETHPPQTGDANTDT